jgi:hypothetical protein
VPTVTPYCHTLMSVTTLLRPRSPFPNNASDETERIRIDDSLSRALRESADIDDLMSGFLVGFSSAEEESGNPDVDVDVDDDDEFEGTFITIEGHWSCLVLTCTVTLVAKRRKLEKAASLGRAASSVSPAKAKRTGISRRVKGRLQNMLSLPFDVLFLVCLPQIQKSLSSQFAENRHTSDILRIGTYGSRQRRPHEQVSAAGSNVTQVYMGLDSRTTECRDHQGS